jgi:hypothetical protein
MKTILRMSFAISVLFLLSTGILFSFGSSGYSQTTIYQINPTVPCDSLTMATRLLTSNNVIVGKSDNGKDVWKSQRGSLFVIMISRNSGCAYKKYLKNS